MPKRDPHAEWLSALEGRLAATISRADRLRRDAERPDSPKALRDAVDALDSALEELHTAEEALQQQNDELIAAHDRLEHERRRYHELFELAPVSYLLTDPFGVIQEANVAASAMLDVGPERLVGKPLAVFVADEDREDLRLLLTQLTRHALIVRDWPFRLRPRQHAAGDVEACIAALREPNGQARALQWVLRDTGERRRARHELHRLTELFAAVAGAAPFPIVAVDRDGMVTTWNGAAERVFGWPRVEVLGRPLPILADAAEPLRVPAGLDSRDAARGHVTCLRRDEPPATFNYTAVPLHEASGQMRGWLGVFTETTPAMSPGDTPAMEVLAADDLNILVEQVAHRFAAQAGGIRVSVALDAALGAVRVHPVLLERALIELLDNAGDAMPGGGSMVVETSHTTTHVLLAVHDSGVGMDDATRHRAFERFFTTKGRAHRGIGLHSVARFAAAMGGTVELDSTPGEGTSIRMLLPHAPPG